MKEIYIVTFDMHGIGDIAGATFQVRASSVAEAMSLAYRFLDVIDEHASFELTGAWKEGTR